MGVELKNMPLVLMYHSVSSYKEDPFGVTVAPQRLERQMRWLLKRGLRGTSVRELLDARLDGRADGLVGLTFDDGYQDFLTNALPILRGYGFNATVFALAGRFGGTNSWDAGGPVKRLLTAAEIREVAKVGFEIGSHGMDHVRLNALSGARLVHEVALSRKVLRELSGQGVEGFCYPWGVLSPRVIDAVRAAGYNYGCGIRFSTLTGQYALARTYVHDRDHWMRLDAKRACHQLTSWVRPCLPVRSLHSRHTL